MNNSQNLQHHPLNNYFERLAADPRLFSSHIALFAALYYFSNDTKSLLTFSGKQTKANAFLTHQIHCYLSQEHQRPDPLWVYRI